MAKLQTLSNEQINEAVSAAVEKHVPATILVKRDNAWVSLHSRFLAVQGSHLLLAVPKMSGCDDQYTVTPAQKLGVCFKLKHHKHICTVTAVGPETYQLPDSGETQVVTVCWPTRISSLQRRAYQRVHVPEGKVVRASFWLGGIGDEPKCTDEGLVWTGRVIDLSAGGFQLIANPDEVGDVLVGESVGVRVSFEAGTQAVYADALFRHKESDGDMVRLGFQFLALGQDRKSGCALETVAVKVAEFQRMEHTVGSMGKYS